MKAKLIKTGSGSRGNLRGKFLYEYGLNTKEDLDRITRDYTESMREHVRIRQINPHRRFPPLPRIKVPQLTYNDIDDIKFHHRDEDVIKVVHKHNGNVQVYVANPKGEEPPVIERAPIQIEEPEEIKVITPSQMVACPDCGREVKKKGLPAHRRYCKGAAA